MSELRPYKPISEMTDEELLAFEQEIGPSQPLNLPDVSPLGRLVAGFGTTPEGKTNILENLGFEGVLRDRPGSDSLPEFFGDVGDVVSDAPEIVGGVLGTLGGAVMAPVTGGSTIPLGAGLGAGAGAAVRQGVGNLLGSDEGFDINDVWRAIDSAAIGEKFLGGLFSRLPKPLRQRSQTANVQQNVMEPARTLGIEDAVPAGARTQSEAIGKAQLRAFADPGPSGDIARGEARRQFRQAQQDVLEEAAQGVGVTSRTPIGSADDLLTASAETLEQRLAAVGAKFDKARAAIPDPSTVPVVVDESRAALARMAKRQNVSTLPGANITSGAQGQLNKFTQDLDAIRNFDQLDAFRQEIGDLLKPGPRFEALKETGADREVLDLYGALARDLDESIAQGQFAREFGGKTAGQITPTGEVHGIRVQGGNPGTRNVSKMEEGVLGEADLPTPPDLQRTLVARGSRNQPGFREPSTPLMDDLAGRIDNAQGLRVEASEAYKDIIALEDATIVRVLKDPDQAENIFSILFRKGGPAANVRRFREKIGASPTEGGAATSTEGVEAFKNLQARIFRTVREESEEALLGTAGADALPGEALPFSGEAMRKSMGGLGGRDVLSEAIGKEATETLYTLADFVKNADPTQRQFSRLSAADAKAVPLTFFEIAIIRRVAQNMFDFALHRSGFPAKGGATKYLTEGFATSPKAQGVLRSLGTVTGQGYKRGQEEFPAGRTPVRQPAGSIGDQIRQILPPQTGIINRAGA